MNERGDRGVSVLTWNLQGSHGVDVLDVAAVIRRADPDVVLVQEIQRGQARRLAAALGMNRYWAFKHLSAWAWPEGLAVLTPHPLGPTSRLVLRRALLWTWRRRIALFAGIQTAAATVDVVNVHLSPHDDGEARSREAGLVVPRAHGAIVGGDFNDLPGGPGPSVLLAAGWTDAWHEAHPGESGGATNWTEGGRAGRPPTQRIDYVMAPAGSTVLAADVLASPDDFDWFSERSDHLPLLARVERAHEAAS